MKPRLCVVALHILSPLSLALILASCARTAPEDRSTERTDRARTASRAADAAAQRSPHAPTRIQAEEAAPEPLPTGRMGLADSKAVADFRARRPMPPHGGSHEAYASIQENDFLTPVDEPRSTFSIDVDTASYSNVRRFLRNGSLPPVDAVRIEELINYFEYTRPQPQGDHPFALQTEVGPCPWNPSNRLVRIALTTPEVRVEHLPPRNLVFLLDVSGSMASPDKLPLLRRAFALLTETLRPQDTVAIVVYAGASGVVLPPTAGDHKAEIFAALDELQAGGSTNGGEGIEAAYRLAQERFAPGGINRVVLATDGDFNVGTTSQSELVRLIERKRESGVYLSVLGFGTGNLKDSTMEKLADKGNGNYAYIDTIGEARKVLVEEGGATLVPVAGDVKLQVEFNPEAVAHYRLIGYENRILAHRDFDDDTKDAGELGAGHDVTALYEIVPPDTSNAINCYLTAQPTAPACGDDLLTVNVRYKRPNSSKSTLMQMSVRDAPRPLPATSRDFRLAAGVTELGLLLRRSKHAGTASYDDARRLITSTRDGARRVADIDDLLELVDIAERLDRR